MIDYNNKNILLVFSLCRTGGVEYREYAAKSKNNNYIVYSSNNSMLRNCFGYLYESKEKWRIIQPYLVFH